MCVDIGERFRQGLPPPSVQPSAMRPPGARNKLRAFPIRPEETNGGEAAAPGTRLRVVGLSAPVNFVAVLQAMI